jgi:hypothetical protein
MKLTPAERECVLGCADDEPNWRVYVDVPSRFANKLTALARTWGVEPQHLGAGVEFELPLQAIRFSRPRRTSERQRRAAQAAIQKARLALRNPVKIQAAEWVGAPARVGP